MQDRTKLFIDGEWVASTGTGTIDVINATTEEVIGRVAEGSAEDAPKAAAAAKAALPGWSATPVEERAKFIQRLADALQARTEEIATTVTAEVGTPFFISQIAQAGLPGMVAGSYVQIAQEFPFEEQVGNSLVVREPIGVVACITPWNYPLHQVVAKVAPALAAGCTVVLKPSEVAPLTAFMLAEILEEIDLPKGVFNLVTGLGPVVGEALVTSPDVDMVSFTGSTRRQAHHGARVAVGEEGRARARRQVAVHHPRRRAGRRVRARPASSPRTSTAARPASRGPGCSCPRAARTSSSPRPRRSRRRSRPATRWTRRPGSAR